LVGGVGRRCAVSIAVCMFVAAGVPAQPVIAGPKPPVPPGPTSTSTHQAALAPTSPSVGGTWSWQNPAPSGDPLYAVDCPTIGVCYAAGQLGVIELTIDGGRTWSDLASGVTDPISGTNCFDDMT